MKDKYLSTKLFIHGSWVNSIKNETIDIHNLILGRYITGIQAFTRTVWGIRLYPYIRLISLYFRSIFAKKKPFEPLETHTWQFRPGIGDIDVYFEINNGRHFVFFDLARYDLAIRMGLYKWVRNTISAFVVAGSSIRYMHRVKPWRKSKIKTRLVGMDEHFFYFHQEIWQRNKKTDRYYFKTKIFMLWAMD